MHARREVSVVVEFTLKEAKALADSMLNDFDWGETTAEVEWADLHGVIRDATDVTEGD